MKSKQFICAAVIFTACAFSVQVNAQLTVSSTGNVTASKHVSINGNAISDSVALHVDVPQSPSGLRRFGVYSAFEAPYNAAFGTECRAGLVGQVLAPGFPGMLSRFDPGFPIANKISIGVAGVAYTGIGVYGATGSSLPASWSGGAFAGYFDGNVKVTGNVTAATVTQSSDARLKENITELGNDFALDILSRLNPVTYTFRQDSSIFESFEKERKTHYGFVAQEMQKILPELVYEDGNGFLSINYSELIPLLVKTIHQQQKQLELLQSQIEELENVDYSQRNRNKEHSKGNPIEEALLYQNNPNPFSIDTEIGYQIPATTHNASLYIYNMNGLQVAEYPISSTGEGSVIISAGALEAGMYLYSLIADGQVIDTKRMILTK